MKLRTKGTRNLLNFAFMTTPRRRFLRTAGLATAALTTNAAFGQTAPPYPPDYRDLDAALARPVLRRELFPDPVVIASVELLE